MSRSAEHLSFEWFQTAGTQLLKDMCACAAAPGIPELPTLFTNSACACVNDGSAYAVSTLLEEVKRRSQDHDGRHTGTIPVWLNEPPIIRIFPIVDAECAWFYIELERAQLNTRIIRKCAWVGLLVRSEGPTVHPLQIDFIYFGILVTDAGARWPCFAAPPPISTGPAPSNPSLPLKLDPAPKDIQDMLERVRQGLASDVKAPSGGGFEAKLREYAAITVGRASTNTSATPETSLRDFATSAATADTIVTVPCSNAAVRILFWYRETEGCLLHWVGVACPDATGGLQIRCLHSAHAIPDDDFLADTAGGLT